MIMLSIEWGGGVLMLSFEHNQDLIDKFVFKLKREKTKKDYKREILKFVKYIEKDYLNATYDDCFSYISFLIKQSEEDKISKATVERIYSTLYSFFTFLKDSGYIGFNHFKKIVKPQVSRNISKEKIIPFNELDRLISVLKEGKMRDYIALMLIFTSGLTIREVTSLKWNQFLEDPNENIGIVFYLNNNRKRYVKVSNDVWQLLNIHKRQTTASKDSYVFLNRFDNPLSGRWLGKVLSEACKKAGLEKSYSPSDLRHSAAAISLKNGASSGQAMEQFGWSDSRLADRYLYSIPVLDDNAIDYMNFKLLNKNDDKEK